MTTGGGTGGRDRDARPPRSLLALATSGAALALNLAIWRRNR